MSDETGLRAKHMSNWTVTRFYSFPKFLTLVRRCATMMNWSVKNETVSKFWMTGQNNWTNSRRYPEYAGRKKPTEISGIFALA